MSIEHTRIDERLIHGQVTVRWCREFPVNTIVVADDEVAVDQMQKTLLPLSAPSGVRTEVLSIEETAEFLQNDAQDLRVFLVVKRPTAVARLLDLGVGLDSVNVGNISHREGAKQVKKSVHVTSEDVEAFRELDRRGIGMTDRMMPEDKERDFMSHLQEVA